VTAAWEDDGDEGELGRKYTLNGGRVVILVWLEISMFDQQ